MRVERYRPRGHSALAAVLETRLTLLPRTRARLRRISQNARIRQRIVKPLLLLFRGREIRNLKVRRQLELVPDLQIPTAEKRRIDRKKHGFEPGLLGPRDQFAAVLALLEEVQLQHVGDQALGLFGHFLQTLGRETAQAHRYAGFLARARRAQLAIRVREALHSRRRHAQGDTVRMAEESDRGVDAGDVAQDARADAVFGVGVEVLAQRGAAVGALVVVVAGLLVHDVLGVFL